MLPGIRLSRDGKHMMILRAPTPLVIDHYKSEIWIVDLDTGALHQVTNNGIYRTEAEISPDNSQVLFISDANQDLDVYYGPSLFVATGRRRQAQARIARLQVSDRRSHVGGQP